MDQPVVAAGDGSKADRQIIGSFGCCCDDHDHAFLEYVDFHTATRSIECTYCGEPGELVNP